MIRFKTQVKGPKGKANVKSGGGAEMSVNKALFLYMSIGSGHQSAARAIEQAMKQSCPDWETTCLDPITQLFPALLKVSSGTYFKCLQLAPGLYGRLWSHEKIGNLVTAMVQSQALRGFRKLIEQENPDVIVCTHALPCGLVAALKKRAWLNRPVLAVVTDFGLHTYWPTRYVDKYIVAAEQLKRTLQHRKVEASKIEVTGIPIAPAFAQETDQAKVKREMGLQPLPTLLIVAGSLMKGPYLTLTRTLKWIMSYLDSLQQPFQIMVVTGMNRNLRKELEKLTAETSKPTVILGYVHNMYDLMGISDLLITKPGGMISAEALAKGVPMILVKPLPGQEEANARFLIQNEVAIAARDAKSVVAAVNELWGDATKLKEMQQKALRLAKPHASYDAVKVIKTLSFEL